jgi:hypothetical protein
MIVILDNDKVRCSNTLELLGHWFIVDNTRYYVPIN